MHFFSLRIEYYYYNKTTCSLVTFFVVLKSRVVCGNSLYRAFRKNLHTQSDTDIHTGEKHSQMYMYFTCRLIQQLSPQANWHYTYNISKYTYMYIHVIIELHVYTCMYMYSKRSKNSPTSVQKLVS